MKTTMAVTQTRRLCAALAAIALGACAPAMAPADASGQDASADSATSDGATNNDGATDAATTCIDVNGAWEWTWSCSDPRVDGQPTTCLTQSNCRVNGWQRRSSSIVGNVLTSLYTQALDNVDAVEIVTFDGDNAMVSVTVTAPIRATCMATGRRVTFPGATSYCCDVARSSCGAGQRCAPVSVGTNNWLATACLPNGTTPLGGACMRQMDRLGTDTCEGQSVCANLGQPVNTSRVCAKSCSNASDCGANEICRQLGISPQNGVCRPRCALFGSDCQPAATCRPVIAWGSMSDGDTRWEPHCEFTGMRTEGMACTNSFDCVADHICASMSGGELQCRRVCDSTHACPANMRCGPFAVGDPTVTNAIGAGSCFPM